MSRKFKDIIKMVEADGWAQVSQRGSIENISTPQSPDVSSLRHTS